MSIEPVIVVHGGAGEWGGGTDAALRACARAAEAGGELLARGSALDSVIVAVRVLEDDPACNAGTGAVLTANGSLELDACVMDGSTLRSGAVACLPPFRNPIDVARAVLDDGRYHLLVGDGAASFAIGKGFSPADPDLMISDERRADIGHARSENRVGNTVGAVALDGRGKLAAATSTGGVAGTHPGRVGDSPIVGAGTYANDQAACSCTGDGEAFARGCAAFSAVTSAGDDPQAAASLILERLRTDLGGLGGLILLARTGAVGVARTMPLMPHAVLRLGGALASGV
jgi:L-asparaginase / beta-aspartyl-peptidase